MNKQMWVGFKGEEAEENFLRLSILSSTTGCGSKKSHISSKAKDPHPLASSGLISFCGLLKDIFSFPRLSFLFRFI